MPSRPQFSDSLMRDLEDLKRTPGDSIESVVRGLLEENSRALRQLEQQRREEEAQAVRREFHDLFRSRFEAVPESDLRFLANEDENRWAGGYSGPPEARSNAGERARGIVSSYGLRLQDVSLDRPDRRRLGIASDELTVGLDDVVRGAEAEIDRRHRAQESGPARRGLVARAVELLAPTDR